MIPLSNVDDMLGQRRRRWPNITFHILCFVSPSFEYIFYGSTAIINIFNLTVLGSTLDVII